VVSFDANQMAKQIVIPLLKDMEVNGLRTFRLTLSNATGGRVLGTATTTVSINDVPGAFYSLATADESSLDIERRDRVNVLSWIGAGQLLRADDLAGPWVTQATAKSPYRSALPLPQSFYRVQSPRPAADMYVPAGYEPGTPMPLVLLLHGYKADGTGGLLGVEPFFGLRPYADSRGFLFCLPNGTLDRTGSRLWNATDACCDFYGSGIDDALYLRRLIERIGRIYSVDRKRIYIVGNSNGGFMAHRMARQYPDLIAGIASRAGVTFADPIRYQPSEPVSILQIHGTADTTVPYGGGTLGDGLPQTGRLPSALETVQMWAAYNHCDGPVTEQGVSMDLDLDVPGLDTVVMRYTSFPPGGAVELWSINTRDHGYNFNETPGQESEFAARVIDWLLAHPKP
jgi:polyhydroxybutyrate depolymerase